MMVAVVLCWIGLVIVATSEAVSHHETAHAGRRA